MKNPLLNLLLILISFSAFSQEIKAEYDKNHDLTKYKTFSFGEGEILTPKDQRKVSDAMVHGWIKSAIIREMELKGLKNVEADGDLVVSYAIGTLSRSTTQSTGPAVIAPGMDPTNQRMYDFQQTSLVIDLNNKQNFLVWRVNSTSNMSPTDSGAMIDQIVEKGFRKYSTKPKKEKKKR